MQFKTFSLALGTALFAANGAIADTLITYNYCKDWWPLPDSCTSEKSFWVNDWHMEYAVNANDGCRNPGVPDIPWLCIDWPNKRLKFYPNNQAARCMRVKASGSKFFCFVKLSQMIPKLTR